MRLVSFTLPDGHLIWLNPKFIVGVRRAFGADTWSGSQPKPKTSIITGSGEHDWWHVTEPLETVLSVLERELA